MAGPREGGRGRGGGGGGQVFGSGYGPTYPDQRGQKRGGDELGGPGYGTGTGYGMAGSKRGPPLVEAKFDL